MGCYPFSVIAITYQRTRRRSFTPIFPDQTDDSASRFGYDTPGVPWLNWIEQPPPKGQVAGSNPAGITIFLGLCKIPVKLGCMILRALLICLGLWAPLTALAQDTDLELVLLADASGSIDAREIALQREGYAQAMTDPQVLAAIANTAYGEIAVTYVEWATNQAVVVDWMRIRSAEDARAFAAALQNQPRMAYGRNAIGAALLEGLRLMEENDIEGWRRVIDFSGDSTNNFSGPGIAFARDTVVAAGVTINGLPILRPGDPGRAMGGLEARFEDQIIGGPHAFVVTADTRESFAEAIKRKLILEIAGQMPARDMASRCVRHTTARFIPTPPPAPGQSAQSSPRPHKAL